MNNYYHLADKTREHWYAYDEVRMLCGVIYKMSNTAFSTKIEEFTIYWAKYYETKGLCPDCVKRLTLYKLALMEL